MIDRLQPHARGLSPLEKWDAAGRSLGGGVGGARFWILVVLGLLCMVGLGILVSVLAGMHKKVKQRRAFQARASAVGLNDREKAMLQGLARRSGLKQPASIFTMTAAFDEAAGRLLEGQAVGSDEQRSETSALVARLREKLGFDAPSANPKPKAAAVSTPAVAGKIPVGTMAHIYRPRYQDNIDAVIAETPDGSSDIEVVTEVLSQHERGEEWEIRFSDDNVLWEVNASVVSHDGNRVSLKPVGAARSINRRRFARAPTNRPAFIAPFMFGKDEAEIGPPAFLPAAVVEIAGPGLKLETPFEAEVGDRVLVGMQLADGRVLQGQGTVRRAGEGVDGLASVVVELTGLTTEEVAELARETNLAMKASEADPPAAEAALSSKEA